MLSYAIFCKSEATYVDSALPTPTAETPYRAIGRPEAARHLLQAARARRRARPGLYLRWQEGHQPRLEQLSRPLQSPHIARSRARSHKNLRRWVGSSENDRRHHEDTHGS